MFKVKLILNTLNQQFATYAIKKKNREQFQTKNMIAYISQKIKLKYPSVLHITKYQ